MAGTIVLKISFLLISKICFLFIKVFKFSRIKQVEKPSPVTNLFVVQTASPNNWIPHTLICNFCSSLYPLIFFIMYSGLENPLDGGTWKAAVYRVVEGWTWLSDFVFTFTFTFCICSTLVWYIVGLPLKFIKSKYFV